MDADQYTENRNAADGGMDAAPDGDVPTCADLNCADDQICDETLVACVGGEACSVDSDCPSDETGCENGTCVLCDADQDGFAHDRVPRCANFGGPVDCNDSDPTTYPGAEPICGNGKVDSCPGTGDGLLDFLKQMDPNANFAEAGRLAPRYIDTVPAKNMVRPRVSIAMTPPGFFGGSNAAGYLTWAENDGGETTAILTRFYFDDTALDYYDLRDLREPNLGLGEIKDVHVMTHMGRPFLGMTAVSSNAATPEGYAGIVQLDGASTAGRPGYTGVAEAFDQNFRPDGFAVLGTTWDGQNPLLKFGLPTTDVPTFAFLPGPQDGVLGIAADVPAPVGPLLPSRPSWLVGSGPLAIGPNDKGDSYFVHNEASGLVGELPLGVNGTLLGEPAFTWSNDFGFGLLFVNEMNGATTVTPRMFAVNCDGPAAPCSASPLGSPTVPPLIAPKLASVNKEMAILIGGEGLASQDVTMRFVLAADQQNAPQGQVLPFALPLLTADQTGYAKIGLESVDVSVQEAGNNVTVAVLTGTRFAERASETLSADSYEVWLSGVRVCGQE